MVQMIYDFIDGRDKEKWVKLKSDPRIKPLYEISNYGRVRNLDGKILRPDVDKDGYLKFTLQGYSKKIKKFSHRLVGEVFIPNPLNKPEINHKRIVSTSNGNICPHDDNYYGNLEWCDRFENISHSKRNNLQIQPTCEKAHTSIFDDDTIHFICFMIVKGFTNSEILRVLGFKNSKESNYERFRGLIKHIRNKDTWREISDLYNF